MMIVIMIVVVVVVVVVVVITTRTIITIIILIIIIIIIIIALTLANRDFYNLLTTLPSVSNAYAQMVRAPSCANHVLRIERLSRATCRAPRDTRNSSAIKFERGEMSLILAFFHWLKPLTDVGGGKPKYP